MRSLFLATLFILLVVNSHAQDTSEAKKFWDQLQKHCGKAYEGVLALPEKDEQFEGKELKMHVRSCSDTEIKIPFFVGDDKSRTWIVRYENDQISLKHDHRHKDGSEDKITMYGGTATNTGQSGLQVFPADSQTQKIIPAASSNVWWITIDDYTFTYNLRRLGTPRNFRVVMDITNAIEPPSAPWGWEEN